MAKHKVINVSKVVLLHMETNLVTCITLLDSSLAAERQQDKRVFCSQGQRPYLDFVSCVTFGFQIAEDCSLLSCTENLL